MQASLSDPEHMTHVYKALKAEEDRRRRAGEPKSEAVPPNRAWWTPEVGMLAVVADELQSLRLAFIAANSKKGAARGKFKPLPRPLDLLAKIRESERWVAHNKLADRLLGRNLTDEERTAAEAKRDTYLARRRAERAEAAARGDDAGFAKVTRAVRRKLRGDVPEEPASPG